MVHGGVTVEPQPYLRPGWDDHNLLTDLATHLWETLDRRPITEISERSRRPERRAARLKAKG